MPFQAERYPANWHAIADAIRERAGGRCEGPFREGWTPPGPDTPGRCTARQGELHPITGSRVVLTVAHVNDPEPMNCDPLNLGAACQRCHLEHDRPHHLAKRKTRRHRRRAAGDLFDGPYG